MNDNNFGEQIFNKDFFLQQIGGDKGLYEAIISEFVKDLPLKTEELRSSIENNNYNDAIHYSHSIKGMCGIIGANVLRAVSEKIEALAKNNSSFEEMKPFFLQLEKAKDDFLSYIINES